MANSLMAALVGPLLVQSTALAQQPPGRDTIPKKVMDALKAKFPAAQIDKWTREKEDDVVIYDIEFKQQGQKFEADIKEDGTIPNWEKEVAATELPNSVKKALEKR